MGIIKTCSEYLRESFWDEMKKKMDGGEEDSLTQRRKEIFEKICDELKRADLFDYASYSEMIKLNEDDGIVEDFFDDETDDEEYLSQEVGWFAYQDLTCDCGFDPDFEWVRLEYFVICSGVRNGESNDDSYDIMAKFYPYTYNEDENENEDGDFGFLMYDKVKDTWFYGANYDGELQKGDINSVVADTLSIATMAVNPNTKYRRSWFEEKDRT